MCAHEWFNRLIIFDPRLEILDPMILEGIVTTLDSAGEINVAPMGPIVDDALETLTLRPFQSSQTYRNLKQRPYGVFHVIDDVLLLAQAAIGKWDAKPATSPAEKIEGAVLTSACRWYEFEVAALDDRDDRTTIQARVVHRGWLRDFFGFNRAKHAVVEAAILATRLHLLGREEILKQFEPLRVIVGKTAGPQESAAFELLAHYVAQPSREETNGPRDCRHNRREAALRFPLVQTHNRPPVWRSRPDDRFARL